MRLLILAALCLLALSACSAAPTTAVPSSSSAASTTPTSKAPRPLVPPITEWRTWVDMDDPKTGFAVQMPYDVPPVQDSELDLPQRVHKIDLSPLKPNQNTLTVVFIELPEAEIAVLRRIPEVRARQAREKGMDDKVESITDAEHNGLASVEFVVSWTENGTKSVRWSSYMTNGKGVLGVETIATGEATTGPYAETLMQYQQKVLDSARSL
ncbi:hypothetical protein [Actinokineospora sp.]|uniref:hypothetical protein n=1 Tax=Actinokineospora sp. TaxID=1872133 RepID=UPI0040379141